MARLSSISFGLAVALASCALPPAVTPEDPPLLEVEDQAPPSPGGLTPEQHQTLRTGGRVEELVELERQGQRYVGGVSYALVLNSSESVRVGDYVRKP